MKHFSEPILIQWCVTIYNLPMPWHKTQVIPAGNLTFPCGITGLLHFPRVRRNNVASEKPVLGLPDRRIS